MNRNILLVTASLVGLSACTPEPAPRLTPLPPIYGNSTAAPRENGNVGTTDVNTTAQFSYGRNQSVTLPAGGPSGGGGDTSLDFADTDIRAVVAQILGTILHLTYTIDPAVHGTVTLHTATPLSNAQLLPTLQTLLAQTGGSLIEADGIYRVVPAATAGATPGGAGSAAGGLASSDSVSGSIVVPLRYASAEDLARTLQPFAGSGARLIADPGRNVLLVSGDPTARGAVISLIQAFDIDILAGQSYALLPVESGSAKDFAMALQDAFRSQSGGALASVVRVVPMERMNSLLIVSSQPRYIEDARRIYGILQRSRNLTLRSWQVYYLQNSRANDVAYVLQQAFTPNNVTAQPTSAAQTAPGTTGQQVGSAGRAGGGGAISTSGGGITSGIGGSGTNVLGGGGGLNASSTNGTSGLNGANPTPPASPAAASSSGNPLLGGLDPTAGGAVNTDTMRIIANDQNNALLIYGTQRESSTIEAMLRKIDIVPLQVRIDATIAEVTLNDQLQYGTQFFFKSGGVNGILSTATAALATPATTGLNTSFPGFIIGGSGQGGAPFAISALQQVTTVHVLSSPELLVLDNQPARLQVGDLVPYLSQTSQSTISTGAPVISSINYQQTGVIMQVTPRVNNGGLVTLDISQEVSAVATGVTTPGINSPTFQERNITSRVVVQDGQTIGLAGLISDNVTRGNQGIPWLKDIPILGFLAGQQSNTRTRTELLVLITPHVLHDQRDARALTEDLRDQLTNAALVPDEVQSLKASGSADPNERVRRLLRLQR